MTNITATEGIAKRHVCDIFVCCNRAAEQAL